MNDCTFLSAESLAEQIRKKKISPVEVAQAYLARITRLNPKLNAFVQVDKARVLADARAAEEKVARGETLGPLHGVPLSIKSSIGVAGHSHEAGTKLRAGIVAEKDATLVARLRTAGAVILGITNAPELLMAWETDNLIHGKTSNPWDLARTAGGSSGGEAAAIAAGCSAGGIGSDGGGSIRVPAHFCGICGLKPTPGRVPSTGHYPPAGGPFALIGVVGPMARTVTDLQLIFKAIAGADDQDPCSAPVPVRAIQHKDLKQFRIGYFEDDDRTPVTRETRVAVLAAVNALRKAGFDVVPFRPENLEPIRQLWWQWFGTVGGMILGPQTRGRETDLSPVFKEYLGWAMAEPPLTGQTLLASWLQRDELRTKFLQQMQEFPLLLCPAAAVPAFLHGERSWAIEDRTVKYLDAWSYTEWFNVLGMPAVVVPAAQTTSGLPIGIQIATRPWEEELALAVAGVLERELGGFRRPPID